MRLFEKLVMIIVVLSLSIPTIVFSEPTDVDGTEYQEAVNTLTSLNIMSGYEDGTFKPDNTITRAEFTVVLTKLCGLNDLGGKVEGEMPFKDVGADYWASYNINLMSQLGIVSGQENGRFNPEESVTYNQAIKMIINGLGFELYAKNKGGYPLGYIVAAADFGITNTGTKQEQGDAPVKRGIVAKLVYNALDAPVMKQNRFGEEDKSFTVNSDKTVLSEYLKLQRIKGVVFANVYTSLASGRESGLSEKEVQINGEKYNMGQTDAPNWLGYNVTAYVKNENGENTLAAILPDKNNSVLMVNAENIDSSTVKNKLVYWIDKDTDSKIHELAIQDNASVVYNGRFLGKTNTTDVDAADLMPESGQVMLIDNNMDSRYDVVFVTSYSTYIVDVVDTDAHKITDKYNRPALQLDAPELEHKVAIKKDGKNVELKDITEWDVLSVARSKDNRIMNIVASGSKVTGSAEEISSDSVRIGEKTYDIARSYQAALENLQNVNRINMGTQGVFCLDYEGKVAAVSIQDAHKKNYAFLVKAIMPSGFVNPEPEFKLFSMDGKMMIVKGKSKIRFNDGTQTIQSTDSKEVVEAIGNTRQLITYHLNEEGKMDEIQTAILDSKTREVLTRNAQKTNMKYMAGVFGAQYRISKDTAVFKVPTDVNGDVDDLYDLSLTMTTNYNYDVEINDQNDVGDIGALVIYSDVSSIIEPKYALTTVVDKITTVVDDEGERRYKLYGFQSKQKVECLLANDQVKDQTDGKWGYAGVKLIDLKQGDVVQLGINTKNEIDKVDILYRYTANAPYKETWTNAGEVTGNNMLADLYTAYGSVVEKGSASMKFISSSGSAKVCVLSKPNVYILYSDSKKIEVATKDDILEGNNVFLVRQWDGERDIIVYK